MKLMARRNSMITSIGKSRWNMSVCITVLYLQLIIPQYFISNKSGIWSLSLIVHSKG